MIVVVPLMMRLFMLTVFFVVVRIIMMRFLVVMLLMMMFFVIVTFFSVPRHRRFPFLDIVPTNESDVHDCVNVHVNGYTTDSRERPLVKTRRRRRVLIRGPTLLGVKDVLLGDVLCPGLQRCVTRGIVCP
jgi:hypothetical protein